MIFRRLLLIYQMPKTGSQTVEATLQQYSLPHQIVRLHFLSSDLAEPLVAKLQSPQVPNAWKENAQDQLIFTKKMSRIVRTRKWFRTFGLRIPKLEVITALREPIGLGLSTIFENYNYFFPAGQPATTAEYLEVLQRPRLYDFSQQWFDWELKPFTGIDVYQTPFPRAKGYALYENGFARVLLYRYEALAKLPEMLFEFLGCERRPIISRNLASSKPYGAAYVQAKDNLYLPTAFLTSQYESKMMRHFYSDVERQNLHLRWTQNAKVAPSERASTCNSVQEQKL